MSELAGAHPIKNERITVTAISIENILKIFLFIRQNSLFIFKPKYIILRYEAKAVANRVSL